jgi:hypothetical protein
VAAFRRVPSLLARAPFTVLVVALAAGLSACGDSAGESGLPATGCGPDQQERIDPASPNHVLRGAAEPDYLTDPPTSGPHAPAPARDGVLPNPLGRPEQVGHLEAGGILFQHSTLPEADLRALEALAGTGVVVVPNDDLPAPVVATAWTRKMVCSTVDVDALSAFAEAHLGDGPGTD